MAKAGKITIAEVEEIVDIGEIDQAAVHVPGIYINRIIEGKDYEKKIEVMVFSILYSWFLSLLKNSLIKFSQVFIFTFW